MGNNKFIPRFLIFDVEDYYPQGGMGDCIGKYSSLEEAMELIETIKAGKAGSEKTELSDYTYIYDLLKDEIVWEENKDD